MGTLIGIIYGIWYVFKTWKNENEYGKYSLIKCVRNCTHEVTFGCILGLIIDLGVILIGVILISRGIII